MAEVKPSLKLLKAQAAYLLRCGKASPEQQMLAYDYFLERIALERIASELPKTPQTELERNLLIYQFIKIGDENGDPIPQKQACREVAEMRGMSEHTVIREYSRWKNSRSEADKDHQLERWLFKMKETVSSLYD